MNNLNSTAIDKAAIVRACPIFTHLKGREIRALANLSELMHLKAGENLFYRGDLCREAYILASGKLIATTATKHNSGEILGSLVPHEIVGEMSLLAAVPRSLTIFAEVDCTLLRLRQEDFIYYCRNNPKTAYEMLKIMVNRTQDFLRHLEKPASAQFVAFLPGDNSPYFSYFMQQLKILALDNPQLTVLDPQDLAQHTNISELFLSLKHKSDYIFYPLLSKNTSYSQDFLIGYADKIVMLAQGDQPPALDSIQQEILQRNHSVKELILVYPKTKKNPPYTQSWLQQGNFFRHHHIDADRPHDLQRVWRFLTGTATGLVLGGGGTRGWAHIGAIMALKEAKIPIDAIGGTSVGGAVGASLLLTESFEELIEKYDRLQSMSLKTLSWRELTYPLVSLFSGQSATQIANQELNYHIENLAKPFFSISCNITSKKEVVHRTGNLAEVIRASASLPGIVPPAVYNNELHVDGAVINNLPVDVMNNFLEDSGRVIAVSLSNQTPSVSDYTFPPVISLWESLQVKFRWKKDYRVPSFFNTFIQSLLMGSHQQQLENMEKADILIQPDLHGFPLMARKNQSVRLIELGKLATQEALEKYKA